MSTTPPTEPAAIDMPTAALPYLIYQRSSYLGDRTGYRLLTRIGDRLSVLFKMTVALKARWYGPALVAAYNEDIAVDFASCVPHLPEQPTALLDIGAGLAGVDILMSRHFDHAVDVHLLDKTAVEDRIYYSFTERGAYYNSQTLTREVLEHNGVPRERIFTHEAEEPYDCFEPNHYDVITSFISWGFHYPLETYLAKVTQSLKPDGVLIIDIRKGTDGLAILEAAFGEVRVIFEGVKKQRILATKPRKET